MWGWTTNKVRISIKNIGYGHFLKGVFSENILYTFSRFWPFPKGGHLSKIPTENWKLIFWRLVFKNDIEKCLHTKVLRRGLYGSRTLEVHYLARSDHGFNFFGYLENITAHLHFRDFGHSQKGCLSEKQNGILKNVFLVTTFKNDIKKCLHTKVLRRGLDGSWLVGF